jgi:hypothetical protein
MDMVSVSQVIKTGHFSAKIVLLGSTDQLGLLLVLVVLVVYIGQKEGFSQGDG